MNSWTRTGPVVVEVDGSGDWLRVVRYAGLEAVRARAELVLVAPYRSYSPMAHQSDEILREAAAQARQQYGAELKVSTFSMEGSWLKVLQDAARRARVLVVGRGHERGSAGLVSAQVNLALAGRAGCPVVVVPAGWGPTAADRSVVVGVDGTPLSLEAVEFAFRTAAERGGDLTVVHSHHLPYRLLAADDNSWHEHAALTVSETLAGWDEEFPHVRVTRLLTTRPVVEALARESRNVGLVVVGAHAGPLPIGDPVARRTIAELTCPVAIVAHHITPAERDRRRREIHAGADVVASPSLPGSASLTSSVVRSR